MLVRISILAAFLLSLPVLGQPVDLEAYEGRLVRTIRIERLLEEDKTEPLPEPEAGIVRNQLRLAEGRPYRAQTATEDLARLNRLGRYSRIESFVQLLDDGSVELIYTVVEQPIIQDVQVVGNRRISDQAIASAIDLLAGTPVDRFQLDRARRAIEELYREKGYYRATVTIDEEELAETSIVLFKIQEASRVRVTDIRFEGNASFTASELRPRAETKVAGIFRRGRLDIDQLDDDVASLVEFYRDRGYLDVRVARVIRESPNGKEAIVIFVIEEGDLYTLRDIRLVYDDGPGEYTAEQIAALMPIKSGDVYSIRKLRDARRTVQEAFYKLGYMRVDQPRGEAPVGVRFQEFRDPELPKVDVEIHVVKGQKFLVGEVIISGNELTQDRVVRRHIRHTPMRPLDHAEEIETRNRLIQARIFDTFQSPPKVTPQAPDATDPRYRDVLVEVTETNTGSFNFGGAVDSDAGLRATIGLTQRNFDIADAPDSFGELVSGKAFRGGGQSFQIQLLPGNEVQTYLISLSEPALLDTNYSGSVSALYRRRVFEDYDEQRFGGSLGVGRRFGTRWEGAVRLRADSVELSGIDTDAPVDVFNFAEQAVLAGLSVSLTRNTLDNRLRPSRGTRTSISAEQVAGDYDFTRFNAEHSIFLPIRESFEGYKTILALNTEIGYIPQDEDSVPVYERFYRGGRSFRGFGFRTVSPKGIRNDNMMLGTDPVGGTWMFFAGAEIKQPVIEEFVSVVAFIDSGTVTNEPGFDDYRVSAGTGIRLFIPQLSPVPLAFDFAVPLIDQPGDSRRLFSFSVDLPF